MKFSIRLLADSERDLDGNRVGQIEVGSFRERFSCYPVGIPTSEFEAKWRSSLYGLIEGAPTAFLQYEPKFAWVVYREGEDCFVREVLALDGDFSRHAERYPDVEGESKVSEWAIPVSAIHSFLEAESDAAGPHPPAAFSL